MADETDTGTNTGATEAQRELESAKADLAVARQTIADLTTKFDGITDPDLARQACDAAKAKQIKELFEKGGLDAVRQQERADAEAPYKSQVAALQRENADLKQGRAESLAHAQLREAAVGKVSDVKVDALLEMAGGQIAFEESNGKYTITIAGQPASEYVASMTKRFKWLAGETDSQEAPGNDNPNPAPSNPFIDGSLADRNRLFKTDRKLALQLQREAQIAKTKGVK